MSNAGRKVLVFAVGVFLVVLLFGVVSARREQAGWDALIGKSPRSVTAAFGRPDGMYKEPKDFIGCCRALEKEGWLKSDRYLPVHGEVWFYRSKNRLSDACLFVYFDKNDRAERIFRAWW